MKTKTKNKINIHYSKLIKQHGYNKFGMGWGNDQLNNRYDIFLKYLDLKDKIIFDYGSGVCNLYYYLLKKKIKFKKYIAYDLNPELIKFNQNKESKKFKFIKNKRNIKINKIDFIISNGVHNYKTDNNFEDFKKDLLFFFKTSNIGFGVSFLNNNVDFKENYLSYLDIKKIINEVQKLECNYIIDQTFKKYETFLIVYKK